MFNLCAFRVLNRISAYNWHRTAPLISHTYSILSVQGQSNYARWGRGLISWSLALVGGIGVVEEGMIPEREDLPSPARPL